MKKLTTTLITGLFTTGMPAQISAPTANTAAASTARKTTPRAKKAKKHHHKKTAKKATDTSAPATDTAKQ